MPGFRVSVQDKALINSKYICSSCEFVLQDPVQTFCGHFYCFSCVDDLKEPSHRGYRCKIDKTRLALNDIFRDRCVSREVGQLSVHCPTKQCPWKGKISQLEAHTMECTYTDKEMSPIPSLVPDQSTAGSFGGCVYKVLGCKTPETLTAEQLKEHCEKCFDFHLQLLLKFVLQISSPQSLLHNIDGLIKKVDEQADKITRLEGATRGLWGTDIDALLRRLINAENGNADMGMLIVELNTNIEELHAKVTQLEKQREIDTKTIGVLKNAFGVDEIPGNFPNMSLSRDDHMAPWDGILLWKIADFARKRNDALTNRNTSFCSPPFYTDRYGYKMCARIYLNGDGMGRGHYISLFFVIMRGEYDALLRWPFRQKVTMMLLDQNQVEHVIDAFKPDPTSTSFKRPTADRNIASGCPMFCPLADLDKHAYVKDDTMFVKVIVDTSEIY